ncbi:PepSY-associated TM helix domain-containing protein [Foetidibacter luteolus]|uniref:PepSY-associated TM helix domain-containing protein n=1 Tax=Foetidibacter luteolus TaxID=2608880 RepID=UPI00129B29B0|nr:PepSY-associated TM helix domain-containing protein [Foetidibacter luteolus]
MAEKKKKTIKNTFRIVHRWLGLVSGLVVFIVAITGALYVFEEEGREAFQHQYYHIAESNAPRLPLDRMIDTFRSYYPNEKITSIRFKETSDAAFVFLTDKRLVTINPVTGFVTGVRDKNRDFFTVIQKIHTGLYMGEVGTQIVKWNVLIFFIMCISGLILWWPKQKRFLRQAIRLNFRTTNRKRLVWDMHSVLGFYALLVLLIISLTGLFWTFDTVKSIASFITTGSASVNNKKVTAKAGKAKQVLSVQDAYLAATTAFPGAKETFVTPASGKEAITRVIMRYPYSIVRKQNTLYYNAVTGKLVKAEQYKNYTGYDRIARSNFDFHTGRIRALGIGSKIVYFLASLVAASLPVTGFLVWWGRRKKKSPAKASAVYITRPSPIV